MLKIVVPESEMYDEVNQCFIYTSETELHLEHSLLSISKWESKWHEPFISTTKTDNKTEEQRVDYIRCMTLNKNVDPAIYSCLSNSNIVDINAYIDNPMTATTVRDMPGTPLRREIITSEVIYFWMVNYGIPFECEKWHINRLIMLIKVCAAKNNPQKMSTRAIMAENRKLNEARKKALGTKG